jgi:hypothetical protein
MWQLGVEDEGSVRDEGSVKRDEVVFGWVDDWKVSTALKDEAWAGGRTMVGASE